MLAPLTPSGSHSPSSHSTADAHACPTGLPRSTSGETHAPHVVRLEHTLSSPHVFSLLQRAEQMPLPDAAPKQKSDAQSESCEQVAPSLPYPAEPISQMPSQSVVRRQYLPVPQSSPNGSHVTPQTRGPPVSRQLSDSVQSSSLVHVSPLPWQPSSMDSSQSLSAPSPQTSGSGTHAPVARRASSMRCT